jgi:hypothetical protein
MLVLATISLVACNRPNDTALPSVTPEAIKAAPNTAEAPLVAISTDVKAEEVEAFVKKQGVAAPAQPERDGPDQGLYVAAQEAAAQAPDTASADEAKKRVLEGGGSGERTSNPSKPQAEELTKQEEVAAMPKPGQANDHSSEKSGDAEALK